MNYNFMNPESLIKKFKNYLLSNDDEEEKYILRNNLNSKIYLKILYNLYCVYLQNENNIDNEVVDSNKTNVGMISELIAHNYTFKASRNPIIEHSKTSPVYHEFKKLFKIISTKKYAEDEIDWYKSMSLNVYDIPYKPIPKIWKAVADDNNNINSNYGYLTFHKDNNYQIYHVLLELLNNESSRRAIAIYNRPTIHNEANKNNMNDFICTNYNHFFIRDNKLYMIYNMRSNDIVYGFLNDFYWANFLYYFVLDTLNEYKLMNYKRQKEKYKPIQDAEIIWQTNSLHIYNRHKKIFKIFKYQ